jgi:hypothetical protein
LKFVLRITFLDQLEPKKKVCRKLVLYSNSPFVTYLNHLFLFQDGKANQRQWQK